MTLILDDGDVRLYQGDTRAVMQTLPAESVHCVVTSPPYWGLRSYDETALRIDPSIDIETRAWLDAELKKRGIYAR